MFSDKGDGDKREESWNVVQKWKENKGLFIGDFGVGPVKDPRLGLQSSLMWPPLMH